MIEFDPNNMKSPAIPKWASFVPGRCPEFKIHRLKGHATSALTNHRSGGIVYEFVDDKWVERYRVEWKCAVEGCKPKYGSFSPGNLRTLDGSPKYCNPVYCHDHRKEFQLQKTVELMQ